MYAPNKLAFSLVLTCLVLVALLTCTCLQPCVPVNWAVLFIVLLILSRVPIFVGTFIILERDLPRDTAGFCASADFSSTGT